MELDGFEFELRAKGRILGAFAFGYLFSQVAGGIAADRLGGKPVMTVALCSTALVMGIIPLAAGMGPWALAFALFINGLTQGPSYPTNSVMLGRWITPIDRSWANSVADSGSPLGGLLAMGGTPIMASFVGWRGACFCFCAADFCFAMAWQRWGASCPEECPYLEPLERDQLSAAGLYTNPEDQVTKRSLKESSGTSPWQVLLAPTALAVMLCHACFNFGRYFLYAWMPTFMHTHFHLDPHVSGMYLMPAELVGCVSMYCGGRFATYLLESGHFSGAKDPASAERGLWAVRRGFTLGGFLGAGLALALIGHAHTPMVAMFALCLEGFSNAMHSSGFKANYQDLTEDHRGLLSGVSNTIATMASTIEPLIVAEALREFYSWPTLFTVIGLLFAAAGIFYSQFGGVRNLDTPRPPMRPGSFVRAPAGTP